MLFVIDVGNTNIVLGLFDRGELRAQWRVATRKKKTADEYAMMVLDLFRYQNIETEEIKGIVIACVVPTLLVCFEELSQKLFGQKLLVIGPGIKTGMPILYENPREVGADRIANAVAAYHKIRDALIVIDFGTATTFDVVSVRGEYMGGIITPGITISLEALFFQASKLPRVELVKPRNIIGRTTIESMQSGIIYGYVGLVDGIVHRIWKEYGRKMKTLATGGLANLICPESETIDEVDLTLTLHGLRLIHQMNQSSEKEKREKK